jgi:hypothetical protein
MVMWVVNKKYIQMHKIYYHMWHRCYPLRLIQMSSQFLSIPDTSHCQPIYTDFVPTMSSTNIPDFAPCLNKESGIRLVVKSYVLRYKLNSGGLDIIFRLFKYVLGVSILSLCNCSDSKLCFPFFQKDIVHHIWGHVRRVWRYQRANQNPYIEEEQTTQWPKEKIQKDKQRSTKHTYKTKDRVTRTTLKTRGELRCSGRVRSSCSTSGTSRVNLVTNPVISREWGKDREVFTTSGTYPWSFVTQIFHNGQTSHGNIFEVMTSTLPKGTLG